ncbi:CAP domain-containing protein [Paenibacillus vietnamensis]|uniref:CAP domain-containing protein n=1 Tax=Paenibacillus vietnamensis TaxID=2590547 RepID=UPI001CD17D34|nr:CAP domain-containing protein [Paenibacillus vietnamensis]
MIPISLLKSAGTKLKLGIVAASLLFASAAVQPAGALPLTFNDTAGHWAASYIAWAVDHKLAQGYGDGSFKPDKLVNEAEFLAMLLRSYGLAGGSAQAGGDWSTPYYGYAERLNWPLTFSEDSGSFRRGQAAMLMAAAVNGKAFTEQSAIEWLLAERISNGRTAATVSGFMPGGKLTRAEALAFFYNLKQHAAALSPAKVEVKGTTLGGIAIGDTADKLLKLLGKPARIDAGEQGFSWYVYDGNYGAFMMFGVSDNRITAQFSNAAGSWSSAKGIKPGVALTEAKKLAGSVVSPESKDDYYAYSANKERTTLFLDKHDGSKIIGILRMKEQTSGKSVKPAYTNKLQTAFEQQVFDLANAERKVRGIALLQWDKLAASAARGHSTDMKTNDFFAHVNPDGQSPFDRMKDKGVNYQRAAENIAAGYANAIFAHYGWMNSKTGHREALLDPKLKRLGTGVAFGGSYQVYYTQNFYSPL